MRLIVTGLTVVLAAGIASAQSEAFYFHQSVTPVTVPGGTSTTYLDTIEPTGSTVQVVSTPTAASGGTVVLPRFIATTATADALLGPIVFAHLNLSANQRMVKTGVGCADITVNVEKLDSNGVGTVITTGTALAQDVPQGGMSGATNFSEFAIEMEPLLDNHIDAGQSIAVTVSVTNNCTTGRLVRLALDATQALTRVDFFALNPLVGKCLDASDKELAKYLKGRLGALEKCDDAINDGSLPPATDCLTEPKTADKLAKLLVKLQGALGKKCTDGLLIDLPPDGLHVASCPGFQGSCSFPVTALDDGTRGNDNDYVDCLACLGDTSSNTLHGVAYRSTSVAPLGVTVSPCQAAIGKNAANFEVKTLKLLQKCRKGALGGKIVGGCPDAKTTAKIDALSAKILSGISKDCTDAIVTGADPAGLGLATCPGPDATCQGAVTNASSEASCVSCTHEFTANCLFAGTLGKVVAGCN